MLVGGAKAAISGGGTQIGSLSRTVSLVKSVATRCVAVTGCEHERQWLTFQGPKRPLSWAGLGNIGAGSIGLADVECLSEGNECPVAVVAQSAL